MKLEDKEFWDMNIRSNTDNYIRLQFCKAMYGLIVNSTGHAIRPDIIKFDGQVFYPRKQGA